MQTVTIEHGQNSFRVKTGDLREYCSPHSCCGCIADHFEELVLLIRMRLFTGVKSQFRIFGFWVNGHILGAANS